MDSLHRVLVKFNITKYKTIQLKLDTPINLHHIRNLFTVKKICSIFQALHASNLASKMREQTLQSTGTDLTLLKEVLNCIGQSEIIRKS